MSSKCIDVHRALKVYRCAPCLSDVAYICSAFTAAAYRDAYLCKLDHVYMACMCSALTGSPNSCRVSRCVPCLRGVAYMCAVPSQRTLTAAEHRNAYLCKLDHVRELSPIPRFAGLLSSWKNERKQMKKAEVFHNQI